MLHSQVRKTLHRSWFDVRVLVSQMSGCRDLTTTYPTGLTSVRTTDVFGRTVSTTGTASAEEFYSYAVASDGLQTTEIRYGAPDGARFVRSVRDSLGDAIAEERPAFGGGVIATTNEYDIAGRVVRTIGKKGQTLLYKESVTQEEICAMKIVQKIAIVAKNITFYFIWVLTLLTLEGCKTCIEVVEYQNTNDLNFDTVIFENPVLTFPMTL